MRPTSTRHALIFGLILLFCAVICSPDATGESFGAHTLTGSQCFAVDATQHSTAAYKVTGSWSGTIQPKVSVLGQTAVNAQATPANSKTPQATITANGAYFTTISGYSVFLLCGNTITGTATIYLNTSTAGH